MLALMGLIPVAATAVPVVQFLEEHNRPRKIATPNGHHGEYFPNVKLHTQDGETVRLYDDLLKGKNVLINFFYANCKDGVCPVTTENLVKFQKLLGDRCGKDVFMYSFSLAPEQDTVARLKHYQQMHGAGPGWTFLTGSPRDLELCRVRFGFIDPEPAHRFVRVDFNGGLGMRTVTNRTPGPPGTWKDLIRFSHDRFRPRPGHVYEGRLYFFSDSKVLLKIIDPQTGKVAWHSDRMPCDRRPLGRVYLEIVEEAGASASVTYDAPTRTVQFLRGDNPAGSLSHLRHARLPPPARD